MEVVALFSCSVLFYDVRNTTVLQQYLNQILLFTFTDKRF